MHYVRVGAEMERKRWTHAPLRGAACRPASCGAAPRERGWRLRLGGLGIGQRAAGRQEQAGDVDGGQEAGEWCLLGG